MRFRPSRPRAQNSVRDREGHHAATRGSAPQEHSSPKRACATDTVSKCTRQSERNLKEKQTSRRGSRGRGRPGRALGGRTHLCPPWPERSPRETTFPTTHDTSTDTKEQKSDRAWSQVTAELNRRDIYSTGRTGRKRGPQPISYAPAAETGREC